jgi:hypothetical protein
MKKIIYPAIKSDDTDFRIINSKLFKAELNALKKGKYRVIVEKYHRKASHEQFKYLYGLVYPLSMVALNDAGYEFTSIDEVDIFWKTMFANKKIINRESGEIITVPVTKSQFLTIDEMTYCDAIRNYCSEYLGTSIPDPDPNWKQNKNMKDE